jgi:hypothetical protein
MTLGERAAAAAGLWTRAGILAAGGLGVVALAFVTAWRPVYGILASVVVLVVIGLLLVGRRLPQLFLGALAVALTLYAFLGRGIAYLGASPIYMGEMVLMLGVLALVVSLPRFRISAIHVILFAFMAWGAARTIPYISQYGVDALRDGVLWGYAAFAIAISVCLRPDHIRRLTRIYATVLPVFLVWVPIAAFISLRLPSAIPSLPGAPVPVIYFKGGDMGVHLAGVAGFLLVGLYSSSVRSRVSELLLWAGWLFAVVVSGAINRGGLLAASLGSVAGLFLPAFARFVKPVVAALAIVSLLLVVNPQFELSQGRVLSVTQLVENYLSVVNIDAAPSNLQGTVAWREEWWGTIVNYTINGPYFWVGKGYGINLAISDGFQLQPGAQDLRAPHSAHFDILARSGVIGLGLWLLFLVTFVIGMARAALQARARGDLFWTAVSAWILAYWLASVVNASFDVYLEGPQGGIWFWALTGIGLAVMRASRAPASDPATADADEPRAAGPRRPGPEALPA